MALTIVLLALAAQVSTAPAPLPDKPRLVCRKSKQETGSHIRAGRRCKTDEEWTREDAEKTRMAPSARITEGQGDSLTKTSPH